MHSKNFKKIFLTNFELYWIKLEFWILTQKNEKKIFKFLTQGGGSAFENFQKNFFDQFWTLLNWARILNINAKKWKKNFLNFWPKEGGIAYFQKMKKNFQNFRPKEGVVKIYRIWNWSFCCRENLGKGTF